MAESAARSRSTSVVRDDSDALAGAPRVFPFDDRDFNRICRLIHQRAGISLGPHKRDMVYSRLVRRVRMLELDSFAGYLDALEADDGPEWEAFINALTTNLTSFFREAYHFEDLAAQLRGQATRGAPQTIWCAAASTGEEPYSLAITACEAFGTMTPPVRIIATDIDTQVLQTAMRGMYPLERIENLSDERKRMFFLRGSGPQSGYCRVKPALQALIEFGQLNLLADDYGLPGRFTAVFCRNVMIYFDKPTQYRVLQNIVPLLAPDARLYAGHSESFGHAADIVQPCGRTTYRATQRSTR